jgi:hypothetical protein
MLNRLGSRIVRQPLVNNQRKNISDVGKLVKDRVFLDICERRDRATMALIDLRFKSDTDIDKLIDKDRKNIIDTKPFSKELDVDSLIRKHSRDLLLEGDNNE